jgi:hypothetical protein
MGSSSEYWRYARECARWAAQTKDQEDQDLFIDMAKAWTHIALVEGDVSKLASEELSKEAAKQPELGSRSAPRLPCHGRRLGRQPATLR